MALCNKMIGLLGQNVTQSHTPYMLNSLRLMSSKLFVGGLSWSTNDQQLKDAFSSFGDVIEARVINDRVSGKSKGCGFVNFIDSDAANAAVAGMDRRELNGRNIRVSIATDRSSALSFGGGGGFRGGYDN